MRKTLDTSVLVGIGLIVAGLLLSAVLEFRNSQRMAEDARLVAQSRAVLEAATGVFNKLIDSETGYRGYVITGDDDFLDPFRSAKSELPRRLAELRQLTAGNERQQRHMNDLEERSRRMIDHLEEAVDVRGALGFPASQAIVSGDEGKARMNALRELMAKIHAEEERLLREREERSLAALRKTKATILATTTAIVALVGGFLWLLDRSARAKQHSADALLEEQERFRITLASIGDAVIATDTQVRVTYLNGVAEALTGWRLGDAAGQPLEKVFHIINEHSRAPVENPVQRVLREGVVVGLANHTVLIAKDGVERAIDDSAAPIRAEREGQAGKIVGAVLIFRDISERRRAESETAERARALAASEARKTGILNTALDCIVTCDCEGRIVDFNPAAERTFGYRREDVIDKELSDIIVPPALRARHRAGMKRYLATGESRILGQLMVMSGQRADGGEFPAEFAISRIPGDGPPMFTAYLRDITARKKMEDELRKVAADLSEADRRKNEFLAMLAHELRNPLAPIRNAVQVMRLTGTAGQDVAAAAEMMDRQLGQMVRFVDDLLDVSRISRGKIELRMADVDLTRAVGDALDAARPHFDAKRQNLETSLPVEPIYLRADPARLTQVVGNLLSNASKFTGEGGRVSLSLAREEIASGDAAAVLRIRDDGLGLAPEQLPRIFEMFVQVDTSLERSSGGLGIGLTLVKSLVEMHGGEVEAHSPGLGRGCEFVVRLPIAALSSQPTPPIAKNADLPTTSPMGKKNILVVDDNRDSAATLAMLLSLTGFETQTAFDGAEALAAAERSLPDAVLLDIGLPKLNGYEVARKIRETEWGRAMVLVALTGWGQEEDRRRTQEAGFNAHMVKPVEHAALMKLLGELLSTAGA